MADDFLTLLRQGRLGLYLGMAAGVGKTVAMLREARRLRAESIDVVCGMVETHVVATDGELGQERLEKVSRIFNENFSNASIKDFLGKGK